MSFDNGLNSNPPAGGEIKINFKAIIILALFLIGLYFLIPHLLDAKQAVALLGRVNKYFILLAVISEFTSYLGAAWLLGIILSRLGHKISFWDRFRIGSIAAFAIHFFPLGSFGEGAVGYYFLRKRRVPAGSILLMLILRIIFTYSAFFTLFLISLLLVPTAQNLSLASKLVSAFMFVLVFAGVIYLIYLYEHKEKFRRVWHRVFVPGRFLVRLYKKGAFDEEKSNEVFEDIYAGLGLFAKKKRNFAYAILAALIYWLGDIFCFFFVFLSFGYTIHFGVLIFGYSIGFLAGIISFIPGGLGVTEGSMALILTSLGVASSLALVSILVFRFFSFWMWIPVGMYSFFSLKKRQK